LAGLVWRPAPLSFSRMKVSGLDGAAAPAYIAGHVR
jgi:hypothetical protein